LSLHFSFSFSSDMSEAVIVAVDSTDTVGWMELDQEPEN